MTRTRSPRPRLQVEELQPRLTPTEVGINDFRLSFMGPDGNTSFLAESAATAYNSAANEYLVVWEGLNDTNGFEIFGQRVNAATGERVGGVVGLSDTSFSARNPAVAYNRAVNEYLVVWQGDDQVATPTTPPLVFHEKEIFGQRVNAATGEKIVGELRVSNLGPVGDTRFESRDPAVVYNDRDNEYLVVWSGSDNTGMLVVNEFEIYGQRLTAAGVKVGTNDFRLSDMGPDGSPFFLSHTPAVAYNSTANEYLVVWSGDDNTIPLVDDEFEIFGQRIDSAGADLGLDFRISDMGPNGDSHFQAFAPAVAYNPTNNEYLVVWEGDDNTGGQVDNEVEVFGQRLTATGEHVGANDFRLSDMGPDGNTLFVTNEPTVAYNGRDNEYLVVWNGSDNTGLLVDNELEIFGQRFSPLDPPPPPLLAPPVQIVAVAFRRKGVAKVRVRDAATGALRTVLTPFRGFRGRLRLQLLDVSGDGVLDLVVKAVVNGKRKRKVFDAVTLTPLLPGRA